MPKKPLLIVAAVLLTLGLIALVPRIAENWRVTQSAESQLTSGESSIDSKIGDNELLAGSSQTALDFVDVSRQVGIDKEYEEQETYGPLWGDLNGDGWVDLIFMDHGFMPSLYLNQQGKRFVDGFERSGLRSTAWEYPEQQDRHGGACADYDNDGDVDLFIAHGAKRGETLGVKYDELLNNNGDATFQDVSLEAGTLNSQGRARFPTWVDYDNDGLLDLYIANHQSRNVLYKNHGGVFADVSSESGLDLDEAELNVWFDYNNDANVDVFLEWPIQTYVKNLALYRNNGVGVFFDVTKEAGRAWRPAPAPRGLAQGNYDNDGDTDVFIASAHPNQNRLYRNDGGVFNIVEGSFGPGERDQLLQGVAPVWGDIDNDGDLDLITIDANRLRFFENRTGANLIEAPFSTDANLSLSRYSEVALADYDNDGYLDLAVNGSDRQYLLKNLRSGNSWLKVIFEGTTSNRMGFGAKVWVTSNNPTFWSFREYMGDTGFYRSAGCGSLHVGLGQSRTVELRVLWPSGKEQLLRGIEVNQTVQIIEP